MDLIPWLLVLMILLSGCSDIPHNNNAPVLTEETSVVKENQQEQTKKITATITTGVIAEQILDVADGVIHYSYYLPEGYDNIKKYPLMVVMPGYNMMWFGEESSGSNLNWNGFRAWTELDEDIIVVDSG